MHTAPDNSSASESVLLALLALFLLASPFATWWMQLTPPWYLIYMIWLGLLGLIAAFSRRLARYDL
jgi:prepilin signal peptidase PulO-like enzyme (type II secretory pathway)